DEKPCTLTSTAAPLVLVTATLRSLPDTLTASVVPAGPVTGEKDQVPEVRVPVTGTSVPATLIMKSTLSPSTQPRSAKPARVMLPLPELATVPLAGDRALPVRVKKMSSSTS